MSRYFIYKILDKHIESKLPKRFGGKTISGLCTKIYRNPIDHSLELTIKNTKYILREPQKITEDKNKITLEYQNTTDHTIIDNIIFEYSNRDNIKKKKKA